MTASPPDPTATQAWSELAGHIQQLAADRIDLRAWFAAQPERADVFTLTAGDLRVDLSKNLIQPETLRLLVDLAEEVDLPQRIEAMFSGERINTTENRSVLHTALRRPPEAEDLVVDGVNVSAEVQAELTKFLGFATAVRAGERLGLTGKPIDTVVNIGIGGSDLGPAMAYQALTEYHGPIKARFVSNIDPSDLGDTLAKLDPETTLFIVASKTFTTLETMTNARLARSWLLEMLGARGAVTSAETAAEAVARHFVAVSTARDKVAGFGIDPANAFGFWDWVGGRYSVGSAIGTVLAITLGPDLFRQFLSGFAVIDQHFRTEPVERNVPALMGLINIWYTDFWDARTHAVLPYSQHLARFPAYLQQLTMESNGKSVRWDGTPVTAATGEVFWGEPGTNGQHAFYQLLHQGTQLVPADFIGFANPAVPLVDAGQDVHELLLANFIAQTSALAFGKTADEVRAEGVPEELVPARVFTGNRPSTSIMAPALTPSTLGQLIALYEHITFTQGAVWGIDSFDQWGVELGKALASQVTPALAGDDAARAQLDPSSQAMVGYYRAERAAHRARQAHTTRKTADDPPARATRR
ncbi:MAG: glucose-6-phosphate isomerase [Bifidobacteriaceae bacterium]|jgi:glucose-6-phosphate isomerase|nr:glucose-6-phosphate isomerase [Bifidobacteriaceae bacterium]